MGKLTVDVILKVVEAMTNIIVIAVDTIKGRNKDDSSGSGKKK